MKTTSYILSIIIVCFFTLFVSAKTTSAPNVMASGNASLEPANIFRIEVRRQTWVDEAVFAFFPQALDSYEDYDSWKMFAVDDDYPQTYTLTTDNVICAINSETNLLMNEEKIIPLGFRAYVSGTFTFTATNMFSFDPTITVYLEDIQENVLMDLRINNVYEFSSGIVDNASRFRLHFSTTVNPMPNIWLSVGGTGSICSGTGTNITVASSEVGTYYQLQNDAGDVNVGAVVAGNGGIINLPTGNLISTTVFSVYATKGANSAELTEIEVVTVNPIIPVSVCIAASPGTTVCPETSVAFTATATNGGPTPSYQWKNNGTDISGATSSTYISPAAADGDLITCVLTSNAACASSSPIISNTLMMSVAYLPVSVNIAASPGTTVSPETIITFTSTLSNGGITPAFQWKSNGSIISGATNSTYTSIAIPSYNGKKFTCEMTSSETCISGSSVTSNTLKITVKPSPKDQVTPEKWEESVSDEASTIKRLSDESAGNDISVYPNPATSNITLDYYGYKDDCYNELKIYSIDGKLISYSKLNNKTTMIDVDSYDAGVYYVKIQSSNVLLIRKFIKE